MPGRLSPRWAPKATHSGTRVSAYSPTGTAAYAAGTVPYARRIARPSTTRATASKRRPLTTATPTSTVLDNPSHRSTRDTPARRSCHSGWKPLVGRSPSNDSRPESPHTSATRR